LQCNHLLNKRRINSGYGLRLTEIRKKSLVYISEGATMSVLKDYGSRCRQYTVNVLFVIHIFGLHTKKICQQKDTVRRGKKLKNHIGTVWNFIHHYNLEIAPRLSKIITYQALP